MRFNWLLKLMRMRKALWPTLMGVLTLSSACAVPVKDARFCSPIPLIGGATCDWLLHSEQKILSELEWNQLQGEWVNEGNPSVCTKSSTVGDLKGEIEKFCRTTQCDYEVIKPALQALDKIAALGKVKLP